MTENFDARALKCPLLFVKTKLLLKELQSGQVLSLLVCDRVGINDIRRYLDRHSFSYTVASAPQPCGSTDVEFLITGKET